MTLFALFHLYIDPLTHFYKNYNFDLAIKIAVLTDFDSGWTNDWQTCPSEMKLGPWV
jgi:hypothetical protein